MTNVLLFMSDQHNPTYSSAYGHDVVQTPQMDRLAARGTTYDSAYCPSPLCVPSRSALMTGRLPHEVRRYNNSKMVEGRYPSYGQVLAEQGVHSVYAGGGSNLYRDPFDLGFSEMLSVSAKDRPLSTKSIRADPEPDAHRAKSTAHGQEEGIYASDSADVDHVVRWLHETAPTLTSPWTLTLNVNPPHPPYTTEPKYWEMYRGLGDMPAYGADQESAQHPTARDIWDIGRWDFPEELVRDLRRAYFGAISYVDHELGRLLDAVEAAGLAEDTLVCYTSDHGEMLGTFGLWGKTSLYEDSARVPLIAAGPGFTPGTRVRTPVSTLDLQAAMFRATGARRPEAWRGTALQDIPADDPDRVVFASYHGHNMRGGGYLVRQGDWKLLYHIAAPHQLFNLADDPHELDNLYQRRPKVAARLERELRSMCDPEAVARDAEAMKNEQFDALRSFQEEFGAEIDSVPWEVSGPSGEAGGTESPERAVRSAQ